ncbi:MAG TPA: hypothetical protein VG936_11315 [Lacunisphaera sp.]|nr:hypothetical protein [Lacunisphaera sp.]
MKLLGLLSVAATVTGACLPGIAGPILSSAASATWEDNITRTPFAGAQHDAFTYGLSGDAEWHRQLSRDVAVQYGAGLEFETCPRYDGLDRTDASLQLAVRRKLGLGPYAPAFRAEVCYAASTYRDSEHNGTRFTADLSWTQRWNDSWQTIVAANYLQNDGRAATYDYHNRGVSAEVRYDLTETWELSAGARRQFGEQVVYAWLGGAGARYPYAYATWKNAVEIPTFGPHWYGYTIDAHADSFWIELSPALTGDCSLPLRFEQTAVVGRGEGFHTRLLSLSFIKRF